MKEMNKPMITIAIDMPGSDTQVLSCRSIAGCVVLNGDEKNHGATLIAGSMSISDLIEYREALENAISQVEKILMGKLGEQADERYREKLLRNEPLHSIDELLRALSRTAESGEDS